MVDLTQLSNNIDFIPRVEGASYHEQILYHIGMAGPVWDYSPPGNGGSKGFSVKTLVDLLLSE